MVRARLVALFLVGGLVAPACGGEDGTDPPEDDGTVRDDLPDKPDDAVRLVSPTFEVAPGDEVFVCMKIPFDIPEDLYVNESVAYQTEGGHHTLLYYVEGGGPAPEPHECGDADMLNMRFIGVGTADGNGIGLPPGIAMKVPAGAEIYAQTHYLNASDRTLLGQDVVDLRLIPASEVQEVAGAFANVDLGLRLPPGEETTRVVDCGVPRAMTVPWMLAHMHELGARFKLEVQKDGVWSTVYESTWEAALRDDFPVTELDPHVSLGPQDRIRTTCTWHNTGALERLFPAEMCATFMPFYPSPNGALLVCDDKGNQFEL